MVQQHMRGTAAAMICMMNPRLRRRSPDTVWRCISGVFKTGGPAFSLETDCSNGFRSNPDGQNQGADKIKDKTDHVEPSHINYLLWKFRFARM